MTPLGRLVCMPLAVVLLAPGAACGQAGSESTKVAGKMVAYPINQLDITPNVGEVWRSLGSIAAGEAVPLPPAAAVDLSDQQLQLLAGEYRLPSGNVLALEIVDGAIVALTRRTGVASALAAFPDSLLAGGDPAFEARARDGDAASLPPFRRW